MEAGARELTPVDRGRLRAEHSRPVLARIADLLQRYQHTVAPNSLLGKALHCLAGQWPTLIRYVDNGAWLST